MIRAGVEPDTAGFVFATTGEAYTILARRAARTMRLYMPDANIDLFTDQNCDDPVFNKIHLLDHGWFRPKMQAIRETRFERSVVLDADMVVLCDITEVFDVLDHCDLAGAHAVGRGPIMFPAESNFPRCLPPINSGFLVVRATEEIKVFAQTWEDELRRTGAAFDQPILREMLYLSDLNFRVIGLEYNLMWKRALYAWASFNGFPRVLHLPRLHNGDPGDPSQVITLKEAVGPILAKHIRKLRGSDGSIGGDPKKTVGGLIDKIRKYLR